MAKGKGNGNGKNRNYWRNKIKNERQQPKAKFRGRLKSKGESRNRFKSSPPAKGKKWADKIKSERRAPVRVKPRGKKWAKEVKSQRKPSAKTQVKKSPVPATKSAIKPAKVNRTFKPRRTSVSKPPQGRRAATIKNKITPVRRISQPVANRKAGNLLKQRQAVVKVPSRNANPTKAVPKVPKLRSAALKNQPAKAPVKAKASPSKGIAKLLQAKKGAKVQDKITPVKKALKSSTSLTHPKSEAFKKSIQTATPSKSKGLARLNKAVKGSPVKRPAIPRNVTRKGR